jgi:hypothetical protein
MKKKSSIPNPSKLSVKEESFLHETDTHFSKTHNNKPRFRGRMISMPDTFYNELNQFLKDNPTEGSRSSFIVRIVANYIKAIKSEMPDTK